MAILLGDTVSSPAVALPPSRVSPGTDDRTNEFRTLVRGGLPAGVGFGLFEIVLGAIFSDVGSVIVGVTVTTYSLTVLVWALRTLGRKPVEYVVRRTLMPLCLSVLIVGLVQPGVSLLTTTLPIAAAMAYLDGRDMARMTVLALLTASGITLGMDLAPWPSTVPTAALLPLHLSGAIMVILLVAMLIWQFRTRLKTTANELTTLVTMSRDLAQTVDMTEVGNMTARYIAEAIGADECGICYWDRDSDRILTYGYYPAERRSVIADSYDLADHPLTREVLAGATVTISDDDPAADPSAVAYLHSIDQRSMLSLPLIAKGRVLGAVEATSRRPAFFDERHIVRSLPMATEAAIALENYRLIDQLREQAFHDALTGLANRHLLLDRVGHAVARRAGPTVGLNAVLFLDLDDFKSVNDNLGHAGGDQLLVAVAERFVSCLRPRDTAARIGGDEFAILLEDLRDEEEATLVARRLIDALKAPIRIGGASPVIGTSIGVAVGVPGEASAEQLMRNADFAMYRAKVLGKGRFEVFRPGLREAATERAALRELLRQAVDRDELALHYQPIVDLADGSVLGLEALVRWNLPGRAMLMPADFISLAEESGLIIPIGRWILEQACRETRAWQIRHDLPTLFVAVNLSARQFQDPNLVAEVTTSLATTGLDPGRLVLEITESVLMQKSAATIGWLADLRRIGIKLAIDDFGTGYSSLSYLERFPIDILKIDKTFVDGIGEPGVKPVLPRAIMQLGRALGLEVTAEGIESPKQAAVLRRLGCTRGQGYLYAKPLLPKELDALLAEGRVVGVATDQPAGARPIPIRRGPSTPSRITRRSLRTPPRVRHVAPSDFSAW